MMTPKSYLVLQRAIEEGIEAGYQRSFKYVENPTEAQIKDSIFEYVMLEVGNYFTFDDDQD